ncbi:MAG: hypothetical protein AB8G23_20270 [Myxococcota bacterium]
MRRALLALGILVGFAVITVALTWFWTEWGRQAYGQFLRAVAPTIYDWIGFGDARVGAFRQRYINFIPFVGLVLVTPGLPAKRRAAGLCLGLFALFVGHLGLNLTERMQPGSHLPFVPSLISDALPFVLWVVIAWPILAPYLPKPQTPTG